MPSHHGILTPVDRIPQSAVEAVAPAERASAQRRKAAAAASAGLLATLTVYGLLSLRPAHAQHMTWAAPAGAAVFFAMQLAAPRCLLRYDAPLSPINWALLVFGIQLVVIPLIVDLGGPDLAILSRMAGSPAVTEALLVSAASFVAFAIGVTIFGRRGQSHPSNSILPVRLNVFGAAAVVVGLAGLIIKFGSLAEYWAALSNPTVMADVIDPSSLSGWRAGASLMMTPFLTTGVVALWSTAVGTGSSHGTGRRHAIITGVSVVAIALTGASYAFNRGTFLGPTIALAAAFSWHVKRLSFRDVAMLGALAAFLALAIGEYKWGGTDLSTLIASREARSRMAEHTDVMMQAQMYGQAPQYFAYLLEESRNQNAPFSSWTIVGSVLSPLPIIGKEFRDKTGVARYNRLIYGNTGIADQPLPLVGELYLSLGWPGVFLGFLLLGAAITRLDEAFRSSPTTFEAYLYQYCAIVLLFSVQATLGAVAQTFIYFFAPIYLYLFVARVLPRLRNR